MYHPLRHTLAVCHLDCELTWPNKIHNYNWLEEKISGISQMFRIRAIDFEDAFNLTTCLFWKIVWKSKTLSNVVVAHLLAPSLVWPYPNQFLLLLNLSLTAYNWTCVFQFLGMQNQHSKFQNICQNYPNVFFPHSSKNICIHTPHLTGSPLHKW